MRRPIRPSFRVTRATSTVDEDDGPLKGRFEMGRDILWDLWKTMGVKRKLMPERVVVLLREAEEEDRWMLYTYVGVS